MGNLIAIKIWTHHGNEVVCEDRSHVNLYELASYVGDCRGACLAPSAAETTGS